MVDFGQIVRDAAKSVAGTVTGIFRKERTPDIKIDLSPTPAGVTRTTSGGTRSTPGSPALPGFKSTPSSSVQVTERRGSRGGGGRRVTPSASSGGLLEQFTSKGMDTIQGPSVPSARTIASQIPTDNQLSGGRDQSPTSNIRGLGDLFQESVSRATPFGARETPPPLTISAAPALSEQAISIGTGVREPAPRFGLETIRQAGRELFGSEPGTAPDPFGAFGTLVAPLQTFFPGGKGDVTITTPQFGTISDEQPTGFKTQTAFELKREQALLDPTLLITPTQRSQDISKEISGKISPGFQEKIDTGQLTIEQAESQFGKEFEKQFESRKGEFEKPAQFQQQLEGLQAPAFDVRKAGEFAGIAALSLTPGGQAVLGGAFVASGLPKITGGETLFERGLGVAEVGLGLFGGGLAVKTIERQADVLLLQELQSQKGLITGREVLKSERGILFEEAPEIGGVIGREIAESAEGSIFKIKSIRSLGEAGKLETELVSPVFRTGDKTFRLTGGGGKSTLDFFSITKGKQVQVVEDFGFGGRGTISSQAPKIISKDLTFTLEDFSAGFGKGFIKKRGGETFEEFAFGGISKDLDTVLGKVTQVKSGGLKGFKLEGVENLFRKGILFERQQGKFAI